MPLMSAQASCWEGCDGHYDHHGEPDPDCPLHESGAWAVRGVGECGVVAVRRLGTTPPFRGPRREVVRGSVAEVAYRRLGGLDQWVMIRGVSVINPALILLPQGGAQARGDRLATVRGRSCVHRAHVGVAL